MTCRFFGCLSEGCPAGGVLNRNMVGYGTARVPDSQQQAHEE